MSMTSDHTITLLTNQRRADLAAEARHDRLVREARGPHPSLFRHLLAGISRGSFRTDYPSTVPGVRSAH